MTAPDSQMLDNIALTFCCQRWLSCCAVWDAGGTWQAFFIAST